MSTIARLERIRQEMPATTAHIYLNCGTFGPIPTCVIQTIQEHLQGEWRNGRLGTAAFERIAATYTDACNRIAQLINARPDEISLTDNTGEGMNIISYGINWQPGDEVITTNHEHISALGPLYQIRDRFGVVLRIADLGPQADQAAVAAIQQLVTPKTRLIVLSHVTWDTGAVLDVQAVGRMAREHGIPVLVDGAQSAGNIPIDVQALEVDFYAIPMQKWLCGPDGTGALYARQESLHYVNPTYVGYYSIIHEEGVEWEFHTNAQRFETGGRQTAAVAGQSAVLEWLEQAVGHSWLFERISHLNRYAYDALKEIASLTLLTPVPGANGLLSFTLAEQDDNELVQRLQAEHNIYLRNIPSTKALRISTGFYNTEEEIDKLVQALKQMV